MSTEIDENVFTFLESEYEIPCDIAGHNGWPETPGPARWIMGVSCPSCDYNRTFLVCDDCKEFAMSETGIVTCMICGHQEEKMSPFIVSINSI